MREVIASGNFTMGAKVEEFERNFAEFVGSRFAVMANSGSSANLLMVAALFYRNSDRLRPGAEVIVPAVSWPTTYYPLSQYGLRLKFVDVDLETLNYDLEALGDAVTDSTRLIMVVNLLGNPNDFRRIEGIVGGRDILVIEDNCESLGAVFEGRQAGTFGLMGTFSTYFSHHMSTMEGGLVVTNDEELYHILLSLRSHGWTRNLPDRNMVSGQKSAEPFEESFKFVLPGYNLRPLELEAAVGIEQLKKLPGFLGARRNNAEELRALLDGHPSLLIQKEIGESSWFGFSLIPRRESGTNRTDLLRRLSASGIENRPIVAGNFARSPVCGYLDHSIHGDLRNADWVDAHGLFVGNHHFAMSEMLVSLSQSLEGA